MFSGNIKILNDQPFKYVVIEDLLESDNYKKIKEQLFAKLKNINFDINDNLYKTLGGGNKKEEKKSSNFNQSFELLKKVFKDENEIINFFEKINSDIFINYLKKNKIIKNKIKLVNPLYKVSLYDFFFITPVYISLKLSTYGTGSFIKLHRDNGQKLYAFLFYFGYNDSVNRDSGGTQICSLKKKIIDDHKTISEEDFKIEYDIKPINNRFAGFEVSDASWHCVMPIEELPDNVERINLQINLMRSNHYTFSVKILNKIINFFK